MIEAFKIDPKLQGKKYLKKQNKSLADYLFSLKLLIRLRKK
jgi:hypothetical protein